MGRVFLFSKLNKMKISGDVTHSLPQAKSKTCRMGGSDYFLLFYIP